MIYLIRNHKIFTFLLLSIPFPSIFILLKLYKLNHFSCDGWTQGLNNSFVDNLNKDFPCDIIIPRPHSCYLTEIGSFFNFVDRYTPNCKDPKLIQFEKKNS